MKSNLQIDETAAHQDSIHITNESRDGKTKKSEMVKV